MDEYDGLIQHPSNIIFSGPTGSGKTEVVEYGLINPKKMLEIVPDILIIYYAKMQDAYANIKRHSPIKTIILRLGKPEEYELTFDKSKITLIVIDDLMDEIEDDVNIANLFTRGSHHDNVSVIILTQNLFPKGKVSRTISINAQYFVLFKNPRDASQIMHLARQVMPGNSREMVQAYKMATEKPYGYLFLDFHQKTPEFLRMQSNILNKDDKHTIVYVTNDQYKSIKKDFKALDSFSENALEEE